MSIVDPYPLINNILYHIIYREFEALIGVGVTEFIKNSFVDVNT